MKRSKILASLLSTTIILNAVPALSMSSVLADEVVESVDTQEVELDSDSHDSEVDPGEILENESAGDVTEEIEVEESDIAFPEENVEEVVEATIPEESESEVIEDAIAFEPCDTTNGVEINETNFPDSNFRSYIHSSFDTDYDDVLSESEIVNATTIQMDYCDITGIEFFNNLKSLSLYGDYESDEFHTIDVSHNTELEELIIVGVALTELNIQNNIELTYLNCGYCRLDSLDLSNNSKLKHLDCEGNNITSLNLSNLSLLESLLCENNSLTVLDVSNNPKLEELRCRYNQLTSIILGTQDSLAYLYCESNDLSVLDISECRNLVHLYNVFYREGDCFSDDNIEFTYYKLGYYYWLSLDPDTTIEIYNRETPENYIPIDETHFPDPYFRWYVLSLDCIGDSYFYSGNIENNDGYLNPEEIEAVTRINFGLWKITENITDITGIEYFTSLEYFWVGETNITNFDISGCTFPATIIIPYTSPIEIINASNCSNITSLSCSSKALTSIDVTGCESLVTLELTGTKLDSLDVSNNTSLETITISSCDDLTSINASGCESLTTIKTSMTRYIESLNVSGCTSFLLDDPFYLEYPNLRYLDISGCTAISAITFQSRQLCRLIASGCTSLSNITVYTNYDEISTLTSIDLSGCTSLETLSLNSLKSLKEINLSGCSSLWSFSFGGGNLESLDVRNCTSLYSLNCNGNKLKTLDLTGCDNLRNIDCSQNSIESLDITNCGLFSSSIGFEGLDTVRILSDGNAWLLYEWRKVTDEGAVISCIVDRSTNLITPNSNIDTGWHSTSDGKYYFIKEDGARATSWYMIDGKYYFFNSDGIMQNGWQKSGSKWYYLGTDGVMQTGWSQIGNTWYYFGSSGAMATGWTKISGKWYFFNSNGSMKTGWMKSGSKWYYFASGGAMVTGWDKISGKWYYFEGSGAMKTGWLKSGGKWYYFDGSGVMVTGTRTISGRSYRFNSSGVCQNP